MHTPLCDVLGIEVPVIQGPLGPWTSVELTAAISRAGALGSLGTALSAPEAVRHMMRELRERTDRPFAVNHTMRPLSEEAFDVTLEEPPAAVSLALGASGELVERAHAAGCRFIQQVHGVEQAKQAAELGADVIIAQGTEAGGFGGTVSTLALVPQVVDAVAPIPVVAAGGIADGRGLAAALVLGAQGINIGTRFLASAEAEVPEDWKRAIVGAGSDQAVKVEFANSVFPPPSPGGWQVRPRVLRTAWVERWNERPDEAAREAQRLQGELMGAVREGRGHELVPFTGQTVGLIDAVLPVERILAELVEDAERALRAAAG